MGSLACLIVDVCLQYDGGYHAGHNVVQWFWEVLDEMPLVKKKQFLAFTTGYVRTTDADAMIFSLFKAYCLKCTWS